MRIHCTDDEEVPIMDIASALERAEQETDLSTTFTKEAPMATKKSAAAPTPEDKPAKKTKQAAAPAPAPEKEKGTFGPRAVPDGHVGLAAVAEELGMNPATARRRLRASETSFKNDGQHGYYWKEGSKDLAAVKKYLAESVKEEA